MPVIISFCVSVGGTRPPLDTCHLFWDPAPPLREALAPFSIIFRVRFGTFLGCLARHLVFDHFLRVLGGPRGVFWARCRALWLTSLLLWVPARVQYRIHHRTFFSYRELHVGMTS